MKFLILFLLFTSFSAQSACLEKLRELVTESKVSTTIPKDIRYTFKFRTELFTAKLKALIEAYPNKFTKKNKERMELLLLQREDISQNIKDIMDTLLTDYRDPQLATQWIQGLAEEMIQFTWRQGTLLSNVIDYCQKKVFRRSSTQSLRATTRESRF